MSPDRVSLFWVTVFTLVLSSFALECYVCSNQEENNGKCTQTIKTCEQEEDVCLTEIKWGSTPYWSQGALKQYYISKKCSTKANCIRFRQRNMPYCTHIWYEDWHCSECCQGDKCNYFVISGATNIFYNKLIIIPSLFILKYILL